MADDKITHVHPDVLKAVAIAVDAAVDRRLESLNLLDLQACQEELKSTRYALADMGQKFETWRKLAELRGDQSERRGAQIEQLENRIVEMSVQVALLTSALENAGINHGDTAT